MLAMSNGGAGDHNYQFDFFDDTLYSNWSTEEITILKEGLSRFANMPATRKYFKIAENLPFKTVKDILTIMRLQRNLNTSTVINAPMSSLEITSSSVPITQNMNSENPAEDGMKAYMDRIDALMQNTKANIVGTLTLQKIENNYHLLSELGKSIVELEERFENTPSAFKHILVDTLKLPQFPVSARKDLLQQALELNHQVIEILHQAVQEPGSSQFN